MDTDWNAHNNCYQQRAARYYNMHFELITQWGHMKTESAIN